MVHLNYKKNMLVFKLVAMIRFRLARIAHGRLDREVRHIRNSLTMTTFLASEGAERRAKTLFAAFCQKVNQTYQWKKSALGFLKNMYMIIRNFKQRKFIH